MSDRVASRDVLRDQVVACARTPGPRGGARTDNARFKTTTGGLAVLAGWLPEQEVTLAAMEAACTGSRSITPWRAGSSCGCATPIASGRKTEMADAEWLADVAAHGMVRLSFVPPPPSSGAAGADALPQGTDRRAVQRGRAAGESPPEKPGSSSLQLTNPRQPRTLAYTERRPRCRPRAWLRPAQTALSEPFPPRNPYSACS